MPWWYKIWQRSGYNPTHAKQKLSLETQKSLMKSWNRQGNQKSFTLTISLEFGKSCQELYWNHCTSTPHRSETNGIAERAVRRVKEGTSAVLLQSGLGGGRIPWECCCHLRNIQDLLSDGKTPHERRFGMPLNESAIPFGAMVEYHPISAKDISRLHQCGPKSLARKIPRLCIVCGRNLERRHYDRRH